MKMSLQLTLNSPSLIIINNEQNLLIYLESLEILYWDLIINKIFNSLENIIMGFIFVVITYIKRKGKRFMMGTLEKFRSLVILGKINLGIRGH